MTMMKEQIRLESLMFDGGISRWLKNQERNVQQGAASDAAWNQKLIKSLTQDFADVLDVYIEDKLAVRARRANELMVMSLLPSNVSAYITMKVVLDYCAISKPQALQHVATQLGQKIEDQIRFSDMMQTKDKRAKGFLAKVNDNLAKANSKKYEHRKNVYAHVEKKLSETTEDVNKWVSWSKALHMKVGAFLIKAFADNMLLNGEPLINVNKLNTGKGKQVCLYIEPTQNLVKWVEEFSENVSRLYPEIAPCVVPPRKWTTPFNGGFHTKEVASRINLVKTSDREHLKTMTYKQMPEVYDAVNAMQETAWCIDKPTLDVLRHVVRRNLPLAVPSGEELEKPLNPLAGREDLEGLKGQDLLAALSEQEKEDFIQWKRSATANYEAENERVSKRLGLERALRVAEQYKNYDNLYFVYALDFRGRVYAQSPSISPQGQDLQKGLIRFSEGLPLGQTGLYWLQIHLANIWGWDKETFADRITNVRSEEFEDMILDIASDPIVFTQWAKADKPWQFLRAALEYAKLLEWVEDGKRAEDFISYTACAMDGSCSGIQHYSVLLRDEVGAKEVNLTNSEKPRDIYGAVAEVVKMKLNKIMDGVDWEIKFKEDEVVNQQALAEAWYGLVNRNLCKPPVMTLPYGSTRLTCREKVGVYLNDIQNKADRKRKAEGLDMIAAHPFSKDNKDTYNRFTAEKFITHLIWESIGEVVIAARAGMKFIQQLSSKVGKVNKPMIWTTPTGFRVKQAVYKTEEKRVETTMMGRTQFLVNEETDEIDPRKMMSSSAPNYIHSMDSSHVSKVVAYMRNVQGIKSFALIHDDFGTHACNTDKLHYALRFTMHDMYVVNRLALLLEEQENFCEEDFEMEVPEYGSFDIDELFNAKYAFA